MPRRQLLIIGVLLFMFVGLSIFLTYRAVSTSRNSFLTGAPPQEIKNVLQPQNVDLSQMRPPALRATDPMRYGNATSLASVIEYGDFECASCKTLHATLKQVLPTFRGKVRFIWRDLPVSDVNPQAVSAAIFARCAGIQGKFWDAHDALYASAKLNETTYNAIATNLKLNTSALAACRRDPEIKQAIEKEVETARNDGINAAPFLFIGTKAHIGPMTPEELKKEIELFLQS